MKVPTIIVRFNNRSRLYIVEINTNDAKTLIAAPPWVRDRNSVESWLAERTRDKSIPTTDKIIFEESAAL